MENNSKDEISILDIPESYQRYLDEIYTISHKKRGGWVSNKELAESLNVKPASVTGMLEKLQRADLILWKPRKAIRLTEKGKRIAIQLNETHELLYTFFEKVLKIDDMDLVEKISCEIEHHISIDVKNSLKKFLSDYLG
ncbi:MAG: metal-dependent transcriptional regulator [Candidatus Hodarchaeota archaeon]